jgi:hypothetical protein
LLNHVFGGDCYRIVFLQRLRPVLFLGGSMNLLHPSDHLL